MKNKKIKCEVLFSKDDRVIDFDNLAKTEQTTEQLESMMRAIAEGLWEVSHGSADQNSKNILYKKISEKARKLFAIDSGSRKAHLKNQLNKSSK